MGEKIAYGPVPSRRLGQSLGINNIPPKICTYSCVYCQLGRTIDMRVDRQRFYTVDEVVESVREKVENALKKEEPIDHLTFVPDGEPTLDINLGDEITRVKDMGYKVAVISNGSLISDEDVRDELSRADRVSLKFDAVSEEMWRKVNRPHKKLDLENILEGASVFSEIFDGELNTETMMVKGMNDDSKELKEIADTIAGLDVDKSSISIPTRPPAEDWAEPPDEEKITEAYKIFEDRGIDAEYIIGYEGDTFASSGDLKEDLLSITSVHPMRERQVDKLITKADKGDWDSVNELIDQGKLIETSFGGEKFYMRKIG
ncbi:MAG: radical SAM protein [Thermoplasmatota archaeon]